MQKKAFPNHFGTAEDCELKRSVNQQENQVTRECNDRNNAGMAEHTQTFKYSSVCHACSLDALELLFYSSGTE